MQIDVSKTGLENLVAQVVADNAGLSLTAAQVTAGAPSTFSGGSGDQNTQVTLTAVEGQGYQGSKLVKYTRLGLDSGVAVPVTTLQVLAADNQAAVETKVATALGLVKADLTFSAYSAAADGVPGSITISAAAASLLYVGADKVLEITVPDVDPDLGDEITTDELNGFDPAA